MYAFCPKTYLCLAVIGVLSSGCALAKRDKRLKFEQNTQVQKPLQNIQSPVVLADCTNAGESQVQPVAMHEPVKSTNIPVMQGEPTSAIAIDSQTSPQLEQVTGQVVAQANRRGGDALSGYYLIEAGDNLEIKFRTTTELDQQMTVRPDGMIALPIVGDVPAAGNTPEMLRQILMSRYSGELKSPDITVIVKSFSGNNIYVGGEVFAPGRVALAGRITTLNAIILAGGFKDTADQEKVMVRRADGTCCVYDLKSVIECKGGQDIQLKPYDVVYVPKSHIAKVNQFVEQYIDKVLPFSRSFGIFVSHNTGLTSAVGSP